MAYFNIVFKLVDGSLKKFNNYEAETYNEVASGIINSEIGWFGTRGDIVNLSNVLSCKIKEVDELGNEIFQK
ncbi:hypothetical protein NST70_13745 [Weizmannia sp. FSL K6-0777]|uniref:hypothetical protein n=1 Tax=Heyndrickxia TaxID=2837504 RepID=UPI002E1FBD30|nr:hypothetical protein [Weizmannia sp. CD-2023]